MAMLRLLLDLRQQWPLQLVVAHCNHSMRPDAAANAAFVRQQAQQLGLDYLEVTADQQLKSEVRRLLAWLTLLT
jgi:tRNA(Ile)-lysidine synthase TilS/MesJ